MASVSQKIPQTILICSIRVIGDVILTTPLIEILKENYPNAAIDIMVAAGTGTFLKHDSRIRNIIETPTRARSKLRSIVDDLGVLRHIFQRYDMAINMNASDRGNLAVICAGKKQRIGFMEDKGFLKNFWKKIFFSTQIFYDTSGHSVRLCKLIAEALGISVSNLVVKIVWDEDDKITVKQLLNSERINKPYFVVHPFARWDYKFWPLESFVKLSDTIARQTGLIPVWTASPASSELALLGQYVPQCSLPPVTVKGTLSLNQMACLISGSSLYIGLDTAVSHIAASTGVPMVTLYGPTAIHRWFPWNNLGSPDQFYACQRGSLRNGHIISIQKSCEHPWWCSLEKCVSPCMSRIEPEDVFAEAAKLLQEQGFSVNSDREV
jgi:heptosyltransferase-3